MILEVKYINEEMCKTLIAKCLCRIRIKRVDKNQHALKLSSWTFAWFADRDPHWVWRILRHSPLFR